MSAFNRCGHRLRGARSRCDGWPPVRRGASLDAARPRQSATSTGRGEGHRRRSARMVSDAPPRRKDAVEELPADL